MGSSELQGVLYLVSTPIGNMEDITLRALRILSEVDIIAAEDTRHSGRLLKHHGLSNRLVSYHDHNKRRIAPKLISQIQNGYSIALISDAGTPGISDPAFVLVREAVQSGIKVIPVPGPTAFIAGLTISGLPTDRFVFEGFLPVKKGRRKKLQQIATEARTIILYESPHRLMRTLEDLKNELGDRKIALCRELTKKFEEVIRGSISEVEAYFKVHKVLGEIILVIHGIE
jgi:16S rRNA (cytidine1402-2'-O)-methyltransferase